MPAATTRTTSDEPFADAAASRQQVSSAAAVLLLLADIFPVIPALRPLRRGTRAIGKKLTFLKSNGYLYACSNTYYGKGKIGDREIVGYGMTGAYEYFERMDFPYPSIRFREIKGDLIPLKEKEKGDWKNLTIDEKKKLYRASFCRTFEECKNSSTGEWKSIMAGVLVGVSCGLWMFIFTKKFICGPLPESCSAENKERQLAWYVRIRVDPIEGLGSLYDYEKDCWKPKKPWYLFWKVP